jgi:hypothetical protein
MEKPKSPRIIHSHLAVVSNTLRRVRKTILAPSRNQIIALLFTALLLVKLLYPHHNADASSITRTLPSQNTNGAVDVTTSPNSTINDTLQAKPTTKFDILDATKNETLGFSKIFYISLPQ